MFDLVNLIEASGYIGLFLIIFAESGILIGFFLPGDSLLFTAGFLASQGYLNIVLLLPLLFVAAYLGDSVGYWVGHKVGPKIFSRPKSFWFNPANVDKTSLFFEQHGIRTIILARFMPVIRTLVPIMAGVGMMKYSTFTKYNAMGAFIWAVGITLLGYLFGNVIPNADKYIVWVVGLIVATTLIPPAWHIYKEKRKK